ncbi:hypothetical protein B296_00051848 [Ensete ventricosum]|uniref:Uncharacterized protein n=1 Tax=Ensete ventricosum TaxID=4639 RepID=A0A426WW52_ENSVE|nr:hypothetical protein B296_00051848 [Ensete ventricosum]
MRLWQREEDEGWPVVRRRQKWVTVVRIATVDGRKQQVSDKGYDIGWQGWLGGARGSNNNGKGLCAGRAAAEGAATVVIEEGGRGWWLMEKGNGWLQLWRLRQREQRWHGWEQRAAAVDLGWVDGDEEVGRNCGGRRRKKQPRERKEANCVSVRSALWWLRLWVGRRLVEGDGVAAEATLAATRAGEMGQQQRRRSMREERWGSSRSAGGR